LQKTRRSKKKNLKAAAGERIPGTIDLTSATNRKKPQGKKRKSDHHVDVALELAQKATASMGKFDNLNQGEKDVKRKKKPKRDAEFQKSHKAEKDVTLKLMQKIVGHDDSVNVNKAVNIAQQEAEARKKAKKGKAGKRRKSKQ